LQIEKEYIESEGSEDEPPNSDDSDSTPELITSREDFESLMDDFLQNYEVSGGKMKPSLPGSGPEKLQSLRLAMGRGGRVTVEDSEQEGNDDDIYAEIEDNEKPERWDVETVLSKSHHTRGNQSLIVFLKATYTNLENHPRLIRAREKPNVSKIRLDPKTGIPFTESNSISRAKTTPSSPGQKAAGTSRSDLHLTQRT
jgi:protein LTV1